MSIETSYYHLCFDRVPEHTCDLSCDILPHISHKAGFVFKRQFIFTWINFFKDKTTDFAFISQCDILISALISAIMLGCYFSDCSFLGDQSNYNSFIKIILLTVSAVRTGVNGSTKHQLKEEGDKNNSKGQKLCDRKLPYRRKCKISFTSYI